MFHNWLHPIQLDEVIKGKLEPFQLGSHITFYTPQIKDLQDIQIAIIGLDAEAANLTRTYLYQLSNPFHDFKVLDLGNIRRQEVDFITPFLIELLDSNIFPVILGNEPSLSMACFKALQQYQSLISLLIIDEKAPFSAKKTKKTAHFFNEILHPKRTNLFHLGWIGCQSHFIDPAIFTFLDERYYEYIRLGKAKARMEELEPLIRNADMGYFHLSAFKGGDVTAQAQPTPSGFTVEEGCQITRYAGLSDKLKIFGIFGYEAQLDQTNHSAQAIAQLVWYFLDGFYNRKEDYPVSTEGLVEYIVELKEPDYPIVFWKSKRSSRWWMQVPVKSAKKYQEHRLIPCSYQDYIQASQGELPDRLIHAFKRFL